MGGYCREVRGEFEGMKGTDGFGCSTVGLPRSEERRVGKEC